MSDRSLVIIPAFNEAASIESVVADVRNSLPDFDVVVIDDGSSDRTGELALRAGAKLVRHPFNLGYGVALQTGYLYAVRFGYWAAVQMDGDGQHSAADVARLASPVLAGDADAVVGSRFHAGSSYRMSPLRRIGSAWFRTMVQVLTGLTVSDPTSGFQALSRDVLAFYCGRVFPSDYPDADMLVLLHRNGFRISEIPVSMIDRSDSPSMHDGVGVFYYVYKMTISIALNAIRSPERRNESGGV